LRTTAPSRIKTHFKSADRRRTLFGYAALTLVGAAILLHALRAELAAGLLLLSAGAAGLAREARRAWLAAQEERKRQQQEVERNELEAARRERAERQRRERRTRRQTDQRQRAQQSEILRTQRHQALAAQQEQARMRAARHERMEAAAARWLALHRDEIPAEIETLFSRRGFASHRVGGESLLDLLLEEPSGRQTVARCLAHCATVSDVQALDAWRRDAERSHAYLIALAGFSPQAVRFARNLPITLVESHLLATWETV